MDLATIRTQVKDPLGPGSAFWTDAELDRYIKNACDRHAQEALSVETELRTSSIAGIREYVFDDTIGEMIGVRYDDGTELKELAYLKKARTLDFAGVNTTGTPDSFYWFGDIVGLDPIPGKEASTFYNNIDDDFDGNVEVTGETVGPLAQSYQVGTAINVATISLYLRKVGNPDGLVFVEIASGGVGGSVIPNGTSASLDIFGLETHYNWTHFSFQRPPINLASTTYFLRLRGEATYQADFATGVTAVEWGVDASSPTYTNGNFATYSGAVWTEDTTKDAMFEIHPHRDDIIVEFYRNVTNTLDSDTDVPEVPTRYHSAIVNLARAEALRKDSYDLRLSEYYENLAVGPMLISRYQALNRTKGRRVRTRGNFVQYPQGTIIISNP